MKYNKNTEYFNEINTENKAYFLGLLAADGCNNESGFHISLHEKDKSVLEKFSIEIFGINNLKYMNAKKYITKAGVEINASVKYILYVSSVEMSKNLSKIGLVPRKSLILDIDFTKLIPENLINHFIRGYFDGDGCLYGSITNKAKRYRVSILSSEIFCDKFQKYINKLLDINFHFTKNQSKINRTELCGNRQVKKFLEWMYKNSNIYMERKYLKYKEFIQHLNSVDNKIKNKSSKHNNITYDKKRNKWIAMARINKSTKNIGRFDTEEAAYEFQQNYLRRNGI